MRVVRQLLRQGVSRCGATSSTSEDVGSTPPQDASSASQPLTRAARRSIYPRVGIQEPILACGRRNDTGPSRYPTSKGGPGRCRAMAAVRRAHGVPGLVSTDSCHALRHETKVTTIEKGKERRGLLVCSRRRQDTDLPGHDRIDGPPGRLPSTSDDRSAQKDRQTQQRRASVRARRRCAFREDL